MSTGISASLWVSPLLGLLWLSRVACHSAAVPAGTTSENAIFRRGIDELAISQGAMIQAKESAGSVRAIQQELAAEQAESLAMEPYKKVSALIPEARGEMLKVRKYAFLAAQHREHVQLIADHYRHIEEDAAAEARKAVIAWISADAGKTAEQITKLDNKGDRLAGAVAAAAEPYHLALLRNQKFCEETYSKVKSAFSSSQSLQGDAKQLALKAQTLQASGLGVEARESIIAADGMMRQAEDLRQWSTKLYSQANTACSSAGGYTLAEQQAAANAAATTIINAPMKLPAK